MLRSTRKVELTRTGAVYYDHCFKILSEIDLSTEFARSPAGRTSRHIRIGLGVAWNKEDPTSARNDTIDIVRTFAWALGGEAGTTPSYKMQI